MATNEALFNSWEKSLLEYIFLGAAPAGATLPGINPAPGYPQLYLRMCKTDPRTSILYPASFAPGAGRNATFEPTAGEYSTYAPALTSRHPVYWEVVDSGGGVWVAQNKIAIPWAAPAGGDSGCSVPYIIACIPKTLDASEHYGLMVAELDTAFTITGGGGAPSIGVGELVYGFR